jgi:hypothetical protein
VPFHSARDRLHRLEPRSFCPADPFVKKHLGPCARRLGIDVLERKPHAPRSGGLQVGLAERVEHGALAARQVGDELISYVQGIFGHALTPDMIRQESKLPSVCLVELLAQARQYFVTVEFDEACLIRAWAMEHEMLKAHLDVMRDAFDMFIRVS